MSHPTPPRLAKWPFIAGDFLLLGVAVLTVWQGPPPLALRAIALCAGAVGLGAILGAVPFVLEYRAVVRLAETDVLALTLKQLQNLESVAKNVGAATAQWHGVQDQAAQTQRAAKEIAERMTTEVAQFTEFLKKANDAEKATLRLEVEKLRRNEGEWLQVVVRILDHVFALHQAAARSSKPEVAEQIGAFQHACRDIARRVGLVLFEAQPGEAFDDERHKRVDGEAPAPDDARVKETVGPGLAFQGRLVRPALVALEAAPPPANEAVDSGSAAVPEQPAEAPAEAAAREPEILL